MRKGRALLALLVILPGLAGASVPQSSTEWKKTYDSFLKAVTSYGDATLQQLVRDRFQPGFLDASGQWKPYETGKDKADVRVVFDNLGGSPAGLFTSGTKTLQLNTGFLCTETFAGIQRAEVAEGIRTFLQNTGSWKEADLAVHCLLQSFLLSRRAVAALPGGQKLIDALEPEAHRRRVSRQPLDEDMLDAAANTQLNTMFGGPPVNESERASRLVRILLYAAFQDAERHPLPTSTTLDEQLADIRHLLGLPDK